jgi:CRP-like cAMP-binding protein
MVSPPHFKNNRLLAALPAEAYERLLPLLEGISHEIHDVFYEPNEPIEYVYFPTSSLASIIVLLADGSRVEAGLVGYDGMVGLPVLFGVDRTPTQALCQIAGDGVRIRTSNFQAVIAQDGALVSLLQRYAQAYFTMLAQNSACNSQHTLPERCARWLLLTHDRIEGDTFSLTQEFLSHMLGVRRAGVSLAMQTLQQAGCIHYSRGVITVVNREGLENAAYECYGIIAAEYTRLLR